MEKEQLVTLSSVKNGDTRNPGFVKVVLNPPIDAEEGHSLYVALNNYAFSHQWNNIIEGLNDTLLVYTHFSHPAIDNGTLVAVTFPVTSFRFVPAIVVHAVVIPAGSYSLTDLRTEVDVQLAKLNDKIDYNEISGLSIEIVEKLNKIRPRTLGQASRISGVTPAAITNMMIYIKSKKNEE